MSDKVYTSEYFKRKGRKGGKTTVHNHGALQMKEWGKLGGWPKGRKRKPEKIKVKTLDNK